MKTTIIVAVILLFAGVVQAQSAPTVQQCRADATFLGHLRFPQLLD